MTYAHTFSTRLSHLKRLLICIALCSSAFASSAKIETLPLGNDDNTFLFTGSCPNGDPYRLFSYQKDLNGSLQSYYDYEGPVGKGTVQSHSAPKVMAARVCRKLAEIINANYWE